MQEGETVKPSGKIRFAVLVSGRASVQQGNRVGPSRSRTGYIQISPSKDGPWTDMKLNYAVPAACWRFGDCVIASEATVKEGNRYVGIRSLVSITNSTDFAIDLRLKGRNSQSEGVGGQGENTDKDDQIAIGVLEPGSSIPVPLSGLSHPVVAYTLQLRPDIHHERVQHSWSDVQERRSQTEFRNEQILDICVSDMYESENLLFCSQIDGSSSTCQGLWFCLSIEAKEIGKDVRTDPIYDWSIVIKSPLSLTYYLPIPAHYTVSASRLDEEETSCSRGTLNPGSLMKVQNVDPRNPLYLSLVPHGGWESVHVCVNCFLSYLTP
jgi:vacuolar protein sorting-associated protein 13A/C